MEEWEFEFTEQHLALMRRMFLTWWNCEFGAPAIDPKRPYGNSYVLYDMAELLGIPVPNSDNDEKFAPEVEERLRELHKEMQIAISIMLRCGSIQIGKYICEAYSSEWVKTK